MKQRILPFIVALLVCSSPALAQVLHTDVQDRATVQYLQGLLKKNAAGLRVKGTEITVNAAERVLHASLTTTPLMFAARDAAERVARRDGWVPLGGMLESIYLLARMQRDLNAYTLTPYLNVFVQVGGQVRVFSVSLRHYDALSGPGVLGTVDSRWWPQGTVYYRPSPGFAGTPIAIGEVAFCAVYEACGVVFRLRGDLDLRAGPHMTAAKKALGL